MNWQYVVVAIALATYTVSATFAQPPDPPFAPPPPVPPPPCNATSPCDCKYTTSVYTPCNSTCNGTQEAQRTITAVATGGPNPNCTILTGVPGGQNQVGYEWTVFRACNTDCQQGIGPCQNASTGKSICQNQRSCTVDASNNFICQCSATQGGKYCEADGTSTNPCNNYCQNGGQCWRNNNGASPVANCNCTGTFGGPKGTCEVDLCSGYCQNGGKCFLLPSQQPACNCTGGYEGPTCAVAPGTACSLTCGVNGTCVKTNWGTQRCQCKAGWSGASCNVAGPISSNCNMQSAMDCVLSTVLTGPSMTVNSVACAAYNAYATCANQNNCPDLIQAWCSTTFAPAIKAGCAVAACSNSNPGTTCSSSAYEACFASVTLQSQKSPSKCTVNGWMANCAADAACPDLLVSYCKSTASCGTSGYPSECSNVGQQRAGDVDVMNAGSFERLQHKSTTVSPVILVCVGAAVAMAVFAAVVMRRRRQEVAPERVQPLL